MTAKKDTKFKKGVSGNPNGRPKGARNKFHADREIANAVASGKSFKDIIDLLTSRIDDESVTDTQKTKYLQMLIDLKLKLSDRELKAIEEEEKKKAAKEAADKIPAPKAQKKESTVESFTPFKIKRNKEG